VRAYNAIFQGAPSDQYLSAFRDLSIIGTDPSEWIIGRETIRELFDAMGQALATSGEKFALGIPKAWAEGDLGWVLDRPTYHLADGKKLSMRLTTIWHREDGNWKLVHEHVSVGVPNEQVSTFAEM
jgi:ketosteroid isomerase-like protein